MKILYINFDRGIPVLGDKGASVHVRSFINAAVALGHEVVLACTALGAGNPAPAAHLIQLKIAVDGTATSLECIAQGLPLSDLDDPILRRELDRIVTDRLFTAQLLHELSAIQFRPDLVYERHALFHQSGVHIAAQLGVPRFLEVNAPLIDEQAKYRGLRLAKAALTAQAYSYHSAGGIIAVSDAVATHVQSVIGNSTKLRVIPNGVDLAAFNKTACKTVIPHPFAPTTGPVVGFIGSFKPWHGVTLLLDVFAAVATHRPNLRLLAVGDGPELALARARASEADLVDKVLLPGRVAHADIPTWLAAMDLTVAPYLPQPDFYFSPMKIVESLAAGRPVIAPRIGQIPELVADGKTGLLFEAGDANDLVLALSTLIDDQLLRQKMSVAARNSASTRSWTATVAKILELAPSSNALERTG